MQRFKFLESIFRMVCDSGIGVKKENQKDLILDLRVKALAWAAVREHPPKVLLPSAFNPSLSNKLAGLQNLQMKVLRSWCELTFFDGFATGTFLSSRILTIK